MSEEVEIAVVGTKGQVVIPQQLREELKIKPKTKLAFYKVGDNLLVVKLEIPPLSKDLEKFLSEIHESRRGMRKPTEKEILVDIQEYRREKRGRKG